MRAALLNGTLSTAQHEAIQRGLGDPPEDRDEGEAAEVWRIAAEQLTVEAAAMPVEELARRARQVRDVLDAAGAEKRFAQAVRAPVVSSWTDQDGLHHGHIVYDDEMAAWVRSITAAGLRPRRGGPRFQTDEERAAEQSLIDDPRTNEQLEYDLLMQVLRAGALATASRGVRRAPARRADGDDRRFRRPARRVRARADDRAPRGRRRSAAGFGHRAILVRDRSSAGHRRFVRQPPRRRSRQRLFTAKQRIALAIRDGGCLWPGCVVPASYCEAHHCDHWSADHGSTDIDRGILLCRFHHLLLHNAGWHIRRGGHGPFLLHRPDGGPPIPVISRSPLRWAWDPPPDRGDWRQDHGGQEDRPVGVPTPGRARGAPN
ncbi:HNH endonuclease signature motif containing protein [Microbacterium elymi]|uniref:HNH endonuclease n=1 Tax=Microbacterium elymi TaxID=2909587 RepID=A0ABY5NGX5_9MICO|nr:HNH endonuclease signature motif containing protein [Microbacterium elymi]UUT34389.1 HNH endonuclease [Microbacterium elymi]